MPTTGDFREILEKIFSIARTLKLSGIVVRAGFLHKLAGGYPGKNHRMPICCQAMRKLIKSGDEVLYEPPSGQGASLEILYKFSY